MQVLLTKIFGQIGLPQELTKNIGLIIYFFIIITLSFIVSLIFNLIIVRVIKKIIRKTTIKWDNILFNDVFFRRLSFLVPFIVIYFGLSNFFTETSIFSQFLQKTIFSFIIFFLIRLIDSFISNFLKLYETFPVAKKTPIKGYIQLVQIFMYIIAVIFIISVLFNKNPWGILSGIGAMTAIILLIFKDSILGFVASIQMNANDMVSIGDWIEVPSYNADGDVIEVSLTTIKVQNWDKTISYVPTYALVSTSFKNWRGMTQIKGRRIKRTILIDVNSIRFLDDNLLKKLNSIKLLQNYLTDKQNEIEINNKKSGIENSDLLNGRHLTNVGTFRAYTRLYIENHPNFNRELISIVRQLNPTSEGLPIEVYFFSNDIGWVNYEGIQSDIFDHLFSILPYFGLRAFQKPGGFDLKEMKIEHRELL